MGRDMGPINERIRIAEQAATQWTELVATLEVCADDEEILIKVADREYVIKPVGSETNG